MSCTFIISEDRGTSRIEWQCQDCGGSGWSQGMSEAPCRNADAHVCRTGSSAMIPGWHTEGMRYAATLHDQAARRPAGSAVRKEGPAQEEGGQAMTSQWHLEPDGRYYLNEYAHVTWDQDAVADANRIRRDHGFPELCTDPAVHIAAEAARIAGETARVQRAMNESTRASYGIPPHGGGGGGAGLAHGRFCGCATCRWEASGHEIHSGHGAHCSCGACNDERDCQLRENTAPDFGGLAISASYLAVLDKARARARARTARPGGSGDPWSGEPPPATPAEKEAGIRAAIYAPLGLDPSELPAYGEPGPGCCPGCLVPHGSSGKCWYCTRLAALTQAPEKEPRYWSSLSYADAWNAARTALARPAIRLSPGIRLSAGVLAAISAVYGILILILFLIAAPW